MDLTQSFIQEHFNYHEGSLYWKQYRKGARHRTEHGYRAGHLGKLGYRQIEVSGKAYAEHRMIYTLFNGPCELQIDHINGVRHDNRVENLRAATVAQNCWNTKTPSTNTSGFKGVTYRKDRKVWVAKICHMKRNIYLGYFKSKELAEEFTDLARQMLHGEFART